MGQGGRSRLHANVAGSCRQPRPPVAPILRRVLLPTTTTDLLKLGSSLFGPEEEEISDHARVARAWQLIVAAVALRLTAIGWTVEALPGNETILRRGAHELRPYSELQAVLDGRSAASQWRDRCVALGIADVPLWGSAATT